MFPAVTQAWYHIVVVGTDLAGLMFAALAARLGYRVAVIGQGARSNAYKRGGHVLLRQPERFYGFSSSPAVGAVFGELSLAIEMKNRPRPLHPALQLILPDHRLDVVSDRRWWARELERELPGRLDGFDRFEAWARETTRATDQAIGADTLYPPSGLRGRSAYRRAVSGIERLLDDRDYTALGELPDDHALRALVLGSMSHLSGLLAEPPSPLAAARMWTHLRSGLYRIPGGLDGLKEIFIRKLREQSSDYRPDAVAGELILKRGKVTAVALADRTESIGCELVVANLEPRRFLQLVPRDQRVDGFHAALAGLQPSGWRLTVNLGVAPKVIPEGMAGELLLVREPTARLRGANCVWLSRPSVGAHIVGDPRPGEGVLQASAILESRGAAPTLSGAERLVDAVVDNIRAVVPWLDDHLEILDSPAIVPDPVSGRPVLDPTALAPVMKRALPQTLGASPYTPVTAYKNVLLSGDLLLSGFGFEGTCLAALQTLEQTRRLVKIKTTLKTERSLS